MSEYKLVTRSYLVHGRNCDGATWPRISRSPLGLWLKGFPLVDLHGTYRLAKWLTAARVPVTPLLPSSAFHGYLLLWSLPEANRSSNSSKLTIPYLYGGSGEDSYFQVETAVACREVCHYLKNQSWGRTVRKCNCSSIWVACFFNSVF